MANNIQLDIKVNAETGQLEVLGAKFDALSQKGGQVQSSFQKLTGEAGSLVKSMLPLASAGAILAFFAGAVKGAEEENQALQRLKFTVEANGQSWDKNKQSVIEWSSAIQQSTRFSDTQALQTLDKLTRATGSVTQAQKASQLAMSLSVTTGKDLQTTTQLVNDLINKQERAVTQARKEFGSFVGSASSAQEVLDSLAKTMGDAAFKEESVTSKTAQAKHAFEDLGDQVGNFLAPAVIAVANGLKEVVEWVNKVGTAFAGMGAMAFNVFQGIGSALKAAFSMDWEGVKQAARDAMHAIQETTLETAAMLEEQEQKNTAIAVKGSSERIQVRQFETEEEKRLREEQAAKVEQMGLELDQKMASIGDQTYQKKLAGLEAEVAARRSKINREIKDEQQKQVLLQKLNQYEVAQKTQLAKTEVFIKQQAAFEIADLAIQTLQTVNSLGDKGSAAERTRAKALLALQQSIAIGWAWVNAMKVGGPFATGLAAATTALIVAQFAQGVQNIDKAGQAEKAGIDQIALREPAPGIEGPGPGLGGTNEGGVVAVNADRSSAVGGGGGGGGTTVINVGGINVSLSIESLAIDNVQVVMSKIYEAMRRGTVEGVQLAVASQNLANKNSGLAV